MKANGFTTKILHSDRQSTIEHGSLHQPIHNSIAFEYHDAKDIAAVFQGKVSGYSYGRQSNPTVTALENKITAMEKGLATVCFSTGMGAIAATFLTLLKRGDHVISSAYLFGNSNSFLNTLQNYGIEITFVDATQSENVQTALQPNTKMVFVETIANPCTQVADIAGIGAYCQQQGLVFVVDNTMTSPYLFNAKAHQASLVINSLSKHIGGHGNALGGSVTETGNFDWSNYDNIIDTYKKGASQMWGLTQIKKKGLRDMGATLAPESAHHLSVGSETLALRMERTSSNALALAQFFAKQPKINHVFYPGLESHSEHDRAQTLFGRFGSLMSIDLDASVDCFEFLNRLQMIIISSNLGDNRTLAIPVAHTIFYEMGAERRAEMGITDGTIRLSVGIEDIDDLIADFEQALAG